MSTSSVTPPAWFVRVDAWFDRLYTWRYNPLYQSGVLAVFLLLIVIGTGTYLVFFYTVGTPYLSMQAIDQQLWTGRWIRTVHRYAADATVVAVAYHALRMLVQRRCWGPRLLAWVSGVILLGTLGLSGLTGFLLVGDLHAQVLGAALARIMDVLPLVAEPLTRAFTGPDPLPRSFYFLTLFVHVSMPLAFVALLWLHTSHAARPTWLPPRALMWGTGATLLALALWRAVPLAPAADPHALVARFPFDAFYTPWLPLTAYGAALPTALLWLVVSALLLAVPLLQRPADGARPAPSFVHEKSCTGCTSCYQDCPYDAIDMVPRSTGHGSPLVARVDPARCVSCGICAAACDPMGVGPAGRTGRDQLKQIEQRLAPPRPAPRVAVWFCEQSIAWPPAYRARPDLLLLPVRCAGSVHTVVLEYALKHGVGGVCVFTCPPRNCVNREGPAWLQARVYDGHDSALHPRVDRTRVRIVHTAAGDSAAACAALDAFVAALQQHQTIALRDLPDKQCPTTESGA